MGSPLFTQMSPIQRMHQVIKDVQMLQKNPNQLGQYLSDHGVGNKDQLAEINKMNGDFSQVGQYLLSNGIMPQQGAQQAYQSIVPTIRKSI